MDVEKSKVVQSLEAVVRAVFKAEDDLSKEWQPKLAEGKFKEKEERDRIADDYVHAIAVYIAEKGRQ